MLPKPEWLPKPAGERGAEGSALSHYISNLFFIHSLLSH